MGQQFGLGDLLLEHRDLEFRALLEKAMPLGEIGSQTITFIKVVQSREERQAGQINQAKRIAPI